MLIKQIIGMLRGFVSKKVTMVPGMRQVYWFHQLFLLKPGNANVLVAQVPVRIGNFQFYPTAEVNRGISIDGLDPFSLIGKQVQVIYTDGVYRIVGVPNG